MSLVPESSLFTTRFLDKSIECSLHGVECIAKYNVLYEWKAVSRVVLKDIINAMCWYATLYNAFSAQDIMICECVYNKGHPILFDMLFQ